MNNVDYYKYKQFDTVCVVPPDILYNLQQYYESVAIRPPDQDFVDYVQWNIQTSSLPLFKSYLDIHWKNWQDNNYLDSFKIFFEKIVNRIFRCRFSLLSKYGVVNYHEAHAYPRIHIPLNDTRTFFVVKDPAGLEHEYELIYGNAYFTNVIYDHKVYTTSEIERKNAFFSFVDFNKNIKEKFLL